MDEMTISIGDLLAVLVRKGKQIIAIGIVFAILLGAYKGFSLWRAGNDEEAVDMAQFEYEKQLEKQEKIIETAAENAEKTQEYIDNSLWMKVNPYDKCEATIQLMIAGVDENAADMTFAVTETPLDYLVGRITSQYMILWEATDLASALGVYEGVEDKYLREMVSVQDEDAGVIAITAIGDDENAASELANAVYEWMQGVRSTAAQNTYAHTLEKFNEVVKCRIDETMVAEQNALYEQVAGYNDAIIEAENEIKKLDAPSGAVTSIVKMVLIGGVVGVVLACAWYCCKVLFGGKVMSSSHAEQMLKVPFIGSIAPRKGLFGRMADMICGERVWKDEQQALGYIAQTMKLRAEGKSVLLVSSLSLDEQGETVRKLQNALATGGEVCCAGDFSHNPDALAMLGACDVVVLLESVDKSGMGDAAKILEFAKECEKPVAGFVLV